MDSGKLEIIAVLFAKKPSKVQVPQTQSSHADPQSSKYALLLNIRDFISRHES
jgi:hypothetical protein